MTQRFSPLIFAAAFAACSNAHEPVEPIVCARPGIASIRVQIRDEFGRPAAIGSFVTIRDKSGYEAKAKGFGDSLYIAAGESRGGVFDVVVTRPFHTTQIVQDVMVPEDECGVYRPSETSVTLALLPDAPPVRQVVTPSYGYIFSHGNSQHPLRAHVVAAAGISQAITWTARDTSVIRIEPTGVVTVKCRKVYGTTWAVAASVADPSKRDSSAITVFADNDPLRCPGS